MSTAFIPVIGQCMGADDTDEAEYYFKKLMKITVAASGALSAGLRAAGDVKFTMVVTVISTIGIRLLLSVLFGIVLDMGVIGIAFAMCADWLFKAVLFELRFSRGKWKQFKVI